MSETHKTNYDAKGKVEVCETYVDFLVAPFTGEGSRYALTSIEIVRAIVAAHDHFEVPEHASYASKGSRVIEFWWPSSLPPQDRKE